jgi:hypothetical protein
MDANPCEDRSPEGFYVNTPRCNRGVDDEKMKTTPEGSKAALMIMVDSSVVQPFHGSNPNPNFVCTW